jgi:hypothetical protein
VRIRNVWRALGTIVVSTLALAGCGLRAGVDVAVKDYEGDAAEVKSCHKVVDAITHDGEGYGFAYGTLSQVWKCAVKRDDTADFVAACYVASEGIESYFVFRKIPCASVGPGCPWRGRRDRAAQTVFLGRMVDTTLEYEREIGHHPAVKTVRVDVFYDDGTREHCGYLDVRVPSADDPTALAAEIVEREWTDPHYSFSYSSIDD